MKMKILNLLVAAVCLLLVGCEYDNYEAPKSMLTGRVVYEGSPLAVRNNGPKFELWQDGFPLRSKIDVFFDQDGSFSASLFDGEYKLVRMGDSPWLHQATDTIVVQVKGNTTIDVPVTPYFTITNETCQSSGSSITAQFTVNKIVPTANIELVRLYIGGSILTDQVRHELRVDANVSNILLGQPVTLVGELPDNLKNLDFVFARVGVKSTVSSEYIYTQVQKIALK
ncbi:DUF3823 domain-containing protein [Sphingobacterium suaedae]|uniref:DUF3823 domain-containing protein n=1 Tax=Sphingobacterium suaedae TaxID=1686402 RepID=A0ABW5KNZ7_9SPHI